MVVILYYNVSRCAQKWTVCAGKSGQPVVHAKVDKGIAANID